MEDKRELTFRDNTDSFLWVGRYMGGSFGIDCDGHEYVLSPDEAERLVAFLSSNRKPEGA